MNTDTSPDIGNCLREGWQLYLKQPMLLSGATALVVLLNALASWIPFANMLVAPPLLAGLYLMILSLDRGEPLRIGRLFDGFSFFVPVVIASVLVSVIVTIGIFLLLLPGIYAAVVYGITTLLIVDRGLDFWPAMETSRKTLHRHFWPYLVLVLLLGILLILGSIPFGLGLLVAVPVCIAAQYCFYRDLAPAPTDT